MTVYLENQKSQLKIPTKIKKEIPNGGKDKLLYKINNFCIIQSCNHLDDIMEERPLIFNIKKYI